MPILDDTLAEPDETFSINLSPPGNATLARREAIGTILDNDSGPSISISDATVQENAGIATLTLTLSSASGKTIIVPFSTADGTATAPADYTAQGHTLSIAPGQTVGTINVAVVNDASDEADESFHVNLSTPVNATIARGSAVGLILDDDAPPTVSIDDATVDESSGTAELVIRLSQPSGKTVFVGFTTRDGTATSPVDFTAQNGQLVFPPGVTALSIHVPITDDALAELEETLEVLLTNAHNATIADRSAAVTITDNDALDSPVADAPPILPLVAAPPPIASSTLAPAPVLPFAAALPLDLGSSGGDIPQPETTEHVTMVQAHDAVLVNFLEAKEHALFADQIDDLLIRLADSDQPHLVAIDQGDEVVHKPAEAKPEKVVAAVPIVAMKPPILAVIEPTVELEGWRLWLAALPIAFITGSFAWAYRRSIGQQLRRLQRQLNL